MPDYNIYLHNLTGSGGGDGVGEKTAPKTDIGSKTKPVEFDANSAIKKVSSFVQNPDSLIGSAKQIVFEAAMSSTGVVGTVLYAAYKISTKVADMVVPFMARTTGDFRADVSYSNFKANVSAIFRPFGTTINAVKTNEMIRIENERLEQKRMLLGDSLINYQTRRM